ncbi:MAG: rane protease subunit stomatin/prohibitin-like protein, partial [Actinomycetia bacterium]|nr:rane protease subunit stomatin/prohibitin-like protein [Actinomycetes bacterium]
QASKRLAAAANVMARDPAALQLRLLQTVVEVAGEKNSTLVMPVPVELLRFFDRAAGGTVTGAEPATSVDAGEDPADLGDAEVAAAEAAISHTAVPELGQVPIPEVSPVPEVSPADLATPELSAADSPVAEVPDPGQPAAAEQPARRLVVPQQETAPTHNRNRSDGADG